MTTDAALPSTIIARQAKSNLAIALACLPAERRRDMVSFYAFCRVVDDIADNAALAAPERERELLRWRQAVLAGESGGHAILQEVQGLPEKHGFPREWLAEIIDGVTSDLTKDRYGTMDELLGYCYKVASVVGLVSVRIFGCRERAADEYAVQLGYALQITNILRDVGQDARESGRIYLPLEDLRKFGVSEADLMSGRRTPEFTRLMDFEYERAEAYYQRAAKLLPAGEKRRLIASQMMAQVYHEILEKLRRRDYPVFGARCRLHPLRKSWILAAYLARGWLDTQRERVAGCCRRAPSGEAT